MTHFKQEFLTRNELIWKFFHSTTFSSKFRSIVIFIRTSKTLKNPKSANLTEESSDMSFPVAFPRARAPVRGCYLFLAHAARGSAAAKCVPVSADGRHIPCWFLDCPRNGGICRGCRPRMRIFRTVPRLNSIRRTPIFPFLNFWSFEESTLALKVFGVGTRLVGVPRVAANFHASANFI